MEIGHPPKIKIQTTIGKKFAKSCTLSKKMKLLSIAFGIAQVATSSIVTSAPANFEPLCIPCFSMDAPCEPCTTSNTSAPKKKGLLSRLFGRREKKQAKKTAKSSVGSTTACSEVCLPFMIGCVECSTVSLSAPVSYTVYEPLIPCVYPCIVPMQVRPAPTTSTTPAPTTTTAQPKKNFRIPVYVQPLCVNPCFTGCGPCHEKKPVVSIRTHTLRTQVCQPVCTSMSVDCIPC